MSLGLTPCDLFIRSSIPQSQAALLLSKHTRLDNSPHPETMVAPAVVVDDVEMVGGGGDGVDQ